MSTFWGPSTLCKKQSTNSLHDGADDFSRLATYHQVRASIPSVKEQQEMQKELADTEKYNEWLAESTGDLHRIKWYRVVLDEAHSIKNHLTHGQSSLSTLKNL